MAWRNGVNVVVWSTVQTRRKIADIHSCRLHEMSWMDVAKISLACVLWKHRYRFDILIGVPIALALGGGGSASDSNKLSADYCHVE